MRRSEGGTKAVVALTSERYLPRLSRQRWSRDRVFFQIEELNALCAQLLSRQPKETRTRRLTAAKQRATATRTAAMWTPKESTAAAHAYVSGRLGDPDDLFGPAFLLKALAPTDSRTRALLAALPGSVARIVNKL